MELPEEYVRMKFDLGEAYIKKSRLASIGRIDVVIFDCDGVLIDVRESYDKAIAEATAWIFETLTGQSIPRDLFSSETIFLFRRSGGFNNDCDIVYGLLMFLLSEMPLDILKDLSAIMKAHENEGSAASRIRAIKGKIHASGAKIDTHDLVSKLENFTRMLDDTGVDSVDRAMLSSGRIPEDIYKVIKNFLYSSRKVGESIIATVFEELFCGSDLFREIYNAEPELFHHPGTIKNGKVIVMPETLKKLSSLIGGPRFGISSGSRFAPAKYVLNDLLGMFNREAMTFLDDILKIEMEYLSRGFLRVNLGKPNPYPLLRSAWRLEPFRNALFVGDSMEDALAVERANRLDPRFLFAGVYAYTGAGDRALREFLKFGSDIISPSVNEIPLIIEEARRFIT